MAWTAPPTFSDGSVLTAAQLNAALRDNLNETAPAKATAANQIFVSTGLNAIAARTPVTQVYTGGGTDSTNSSSYTALTGGATVTVNTGTSAIVAHGAQMSGDTVGGRSFASWAVSGASTVAASDSWGVAYDCNSANRIVKASWVHLATGLTAGANTFTQQFRSTSGIATFATRNICVIPL